MTTTMQAETFAPKCGAAYEHLLSTLSAVLHSTPVADRTEARAAQAVAIIAAADFFLSTMPPEIAQHYKELAKALNAVVGLSMRVVPHAG
jgi:hypothetical protein